jgi:SAM-dependent methyltransferase
MHTQAEYQSLALETFVVTGEPPVAVYGDHWGEISRAPHLQTVLNEWLLPRAQGAALLEIGCGGGRWTRCFAPLVERAWLVDATPAAAAAVLRHVQGPFGFVFSRDGELPAIPAESIDYVFSFDTFVHFDVPLFDAYVREIGRVLRPGGILHLHFAHAPSAESIDPEIFRYRELADVAAVCATAGVLLNGRRQSFGGYGSLLVEGRRQVCPTG